MKREDRIKPKGIFFKMEWDELFNDLDDASVGKLIKNVYNQSNDRDLIEMDKTESLLFRHTIVPVLEYNQEKYNQKVEHNRTIASKGGRKAKESSNPMGFSETQNIPLGILTNPKNPKDIDKEKFKEREKEIEKIKCKAEIDKMKKIAEFDINEISNNEERSFCMKVKELVRILEWHRFVLLVFHTTEKNVENTLSEYDMLACLNGIQDIKKAYPLMLDKIIR
jgi:hypothetical protein